MNGKGDKQRPTNKAAFDANFDNIFGKKDKSDKKDDKPKEKENDTAPKNT
tara:strand:+ start:62 stop:211 length:150 start_codon:yes stop_codon:yes gene_type:complete